MKRQSLRLGFGEYVFRAQRLERELFIRAVFKVVPEASSQITAALRYAANQTDEHCARTRIVTLRAVFAKMLIDHHVIERVALARGSTPRDLIIELGTFAGRVNEYINGLAARWHLTDDWCRELLFQVAMFGCPVHYFAKIEQAPFQIEDDGWDYTAISYSQFEDHILARVKQKLSEYRIRAETEARGRGLTKTVEKREPEHYKWLVRHVVKDEPIFQIWRSLLRNRKKRQPGEPSRQSVRQAIERTAVEIGLSLCHEETRIDTLPAAGAPAQNS